MKIFRRLSNGPLTTRFASTFAFTFAIGLAALIFFSRETSDKAVTATGSSSSSAATEVAAGTEEVEKSNVTDGDSLSSASAVAETHSSETAARSNNFMSETNQASPEDAARSGQVGSDASSRTNGLEQIAINRNSATFPESSTTFSNQPALSSADKNLGSGNSSTGDATDNRAAYPSGRNRFPLGQPLTLEEDEYRSLYGWAAFEAQQAEAFYESHQ